MSDEGPQRASASPVSDSQPGKERAGKERGTESRQDRARVWQLLGPPTDQLGSVNDPRSEREHGCEWNEKWIYRAPGGSEIVRVALFNRYDLQGIFRLCADGSALAESLPGEAGPTLDALPGAQS